MRIQYLLPVLALAACAAVPPVPAAPTPDPAATPVPPTGDGICVGTSLASFVGQTRSEALGAQIRAASGAKSLRWVEKGMMVTMDFRDDRVTIYLDEANRIVSANCG